MRLRSTAILMMFLSIAARRGCSAFVVQTPHPAVARGTVKAVPNAAPRLATVTSGSSFSRLFASSSTSSSSLPEIDTMRAGELKKELESYGISTKSFLEKKELVAALQKARADGLQPKKTTTSSSQSASASSRTSTGSSSSSSSSSSSELPREERLEKEISNCQKMKASEIKKELQERGVSTKALFEKYEFVQALAEARVDGVTRGGGGGGGGVDEEGYAEYTNVEVLTDDSAGPRKKSSGAQQQPQQQSNPFGDMFGGGGGMPGGMGGMGGIADMLKNMAGGAGGGAAGADPFGGANPFGGGGPGGFGGMGDAMGKAQQMMQNPKVREIVAKAQGNPKIMKIMNECMSNPANMSKYENDPDVRELIQEMRKFL